MFPDAEMPLVNQPSVERSRARGIFAAVGPVVLVSLMCITFAGGRRGLKASSASVVPLRLDAEEQAACDEPIQNQIVSLCLDILFIWPLGVALRAKWNFFTYYKLSFSQTAFFSYASLVGFLTFEFTDSLQNGDIACMPMYTAVPIGTVGGLALTSINFLLPSRKVVANFGLGDHVQYTGPAESWPDGERVAPNLKGFVVGAGTIQLPEILGEGVDVMFEGNKAPTTAGTTTIKLME